MQTFTVRDLRERTGELIRGAEQGELSVITKHGTPVFIAVPFDDQLARSGFMKSLAMKLFAEGQIGSGSGARLCGMGRAEFIEMLGANHIPVIDLTPEELREELRVAGELFTRA